MDHPASPAVDVSSSRPALQEVLARSEAALRQQRAEMARMMTELRELYQAACGRHSQEAAAWRSENQQLQQALRQREQELAEWDQRCRAAEGQVAQLEELQQRLLTQAESALQEQHGELTRILDEVRGLGALAPVAVPATEPAAASDSNHWQQLLLEQERQLADAVQRACTAEARVPQLEALQHEVAALKARLHEREASDQQPRKESGVEQVRVLQKELIAFQHQLQEKELQVEELQTAQAEVTDLRRELAEKNAEVEQLQSYQAEVAVLRERLQEKQAQLQRAQASEPAHRPAPPADAADYEAELAEYHRQLETDRQNLNEQIAHLKKRNLELDEAARKAEEELAKERARLHGHSRLDRAFEELGNKEFERNRTGKDRSTIVTQLRFKERDEAPAAVSGRK